MAQRYRKSPHTRGRIVDGLAMVVAGDQRRWHTLNRTATRVWQLAEGGVSAEEAAEDVGRELNLDRETAMADVQANLDELIHRHILTAE